MTNIIFYNYNHLLISARNFARLRNLGFNCCHISIHKLQWNECMTFAWFLRIVIVIPLPCSKAEQSFTSRRKEAL